MSSKTTSADLEVLSLLPPYEGKTILAIGEAILDLTNQLSDKAGKVLAVQFTESVTNERKEHVKFISTNVSAPSLDISSGFINLIFAKSLFVHLSHNEVEKVVQSMAKWLKLEGFICFTETCLDDHADASGKNVNGCDFLTVICYGFTSQHLL